MPQVSCRSDGGGLGGGPPPHVVAIGSSASLDQRQRGRGSPEAEFRPTNAFLYSLALPASISTR